MKILSRFLILFFLFTSKTFALNPENRLPKEQDEARANAIFVEVKCLVCEAQSVASSNTEFSLQMRNLVRQKVAAGKSDEQIKKELVEEFGDAVLLSPLFKDAGIIVWILPFIFALLLGLVLMKRR